MLEEIDILYKDSDVIVISKPAGLLTHAIKHTSEPSVASLLAEYIDDPESDRAGIVHRLDKDTSGVMIVARKTSARHFLQNQFKERKVEKVYLALVVGKLEPVKARLELPLRRSYKNPTKMQVHKDGKIAISEYAVEQYYANTNTNTTYLTMQIFTGRTHQIRAQLGYLGHPIVGDKLYNPHANHQELGRQFLHASRLALELPSGEKKSFLAPLAQDLKDYLTTLQ